MSSGEPIKRQKVEFKETSQTVKSFPSVKHENKPDTLTLNQENARLNAENNRLNEFISKHNSAWARLVKDIRTLCQAYSYEKYDNSPFNSLIEDEEGLSQMSELTRAGFRQLLAAVDRLRAGFPQDELGMKNKELTDSFVRAGFQISESQCEIQRLNDSLIRKSADLAKATALNEELRSVKENLTGKISVAESALKCKCPCRCGARKSESNITQEEFADMKDLKDLVAKLQSEKDYLKLNLEDQIQKSQKMQIELEVSEERFVRTKAYKSLISQARTLYQNFNIIKKKNEELQKVNDEFNEAKEREINSVIADEEKKISNLYEQISSLNLKIVIIGKEKDEIKFEFEALKNDKSTQRNTEYYVNFIEEIDKEKHALKKKIVDMKREKSDLENKIEDYLAQIMELKDNLHLKDIEVSSLKIRLEDNPNPNNEVDLDTRLKEQRNQILELKQHIKAKDHLISKLEGQVKHLKQDLKSEKKGNESLINEIEVTGNAYEETMKKNKTLTHLLNEKEQNYIQLMNERVKESNWKMLHEKEKQAYECKILYKDEQIAKLRDFIKELENKLKFQNDLSSSFDSKLKIFEERLKHNHNQNEELTRKNEELQAAKKDYHDKMWKTERLSIKNATDAIQFQFMYQQTLKQAKVYEDKWHEAEERIVIKSTEANLNSELTKYRKLTRCGICTTRVKDVVISKCFHCFCRKCIEENLMNRKRKCPTCLGKYSLEDVKTLLWK